MNPRLPKVSVVIPCYRQGQYLAQAVHCLEKQTYPNVEIVVVNDGSDDNTDEVARSFGSRIVYISQPNGGHAAARNAGIAAATGTHLLFLDADDLIHPEVIQQLVNALDGSPAGTTAMMGYRMFHVENEFYRTVLPPEGTSFFPWVLLRNYQFNGFLVPTAVAQAAGGFDSKMASHEDHDFWLRVAFHSDQLRTIQVAGAYYRQHPTSESRNPQKMRLGRRQLWANMVKYLGQHPEIEKKYGSLVLRQLYVARMMLAAQVPGESREDLDGLIRTLHSRGVRYRWAVDWAYRLTPGPLRDFADRLIPTVLRLVKPAKYGQLKDNRSGNEEST
jgi:glycosyltransferase involved in cell wall biosynthesis